MQVTQGGTGMQMISFNGYYNSGEQRYNTAKTMWRIQADQRNLTNPGTGLQSDNFTIWRAGVTGTYNNGYVIHADENLSIGIRNNTPKTGFHVSANSIFEDNTTAAFPSPIYGNSGALRLGAYGGDQANNLVGAYAWLQTNANAPLLLNPLSTQYVGIGFLNVTGTNVPQSGYLLAVNGGVECTKLRIRNYTSWPDYVFANDYKLPSLSEVEKYINTNGHLPNIPSASTVSKEGYEASEMTAKLLEKIEELTLYVIELKKQNESLVKQQQALETRVDQLSK
jgi:hypothetical protein